MLFHTTCARDESALVTLCFHALIAKQKLRDTLAVPVRPAYSHPKRMEILTGYEHTYSRTRCTSARAADICLEGTLRERQAFDVYLKS